MSEQVCECVTLSPNTNRKDGVHSECRLLQTLTIEPNEYSGPHLLGVSESGDLYATLVADAPLSTVLRFIRSA